MGQKNGLHAFRYNSAESEPIWMKFGTLWAKCWGLALADFWRDPRSSDSFRGSRSCAKTAEAIEVPYASTTLVGPGKHLLHIADRFWRILYCVHSLCIVTTDWRLSYWYHSIYIYI